NVRSLNRKSNEHRLFGGCCCVVCLRHLLVAGQRGAAASVLCVGTSSVTSGWLARFVVDISRIELQQSLQRGFGWPHLSFHHYPHPYSHSHPRRHRGRSSNDY